MHMDEYCSQSSKIYCERAKIQSVQELNREYKKMAIALQIHVVY